MVDQIKSSHMGYGWGTLATNGEESRRELAKRTPVISRMFCTNWFLILPVQKSDCWIDF